MNQLYIVILIFIVFSINSVTAKKPMDWDDIMKFKGMSQISVSNNGNWVAYQLKPDRGDGVVRFRNTNDTIKYFEIERGSLPTFSDNSLWGATMIVPKEIDVDNASNSKDIPKNELSIINLETGKTVNYKDIRTYNFSNDSKWIAFMYNQSNSDNSSKMDEKIVGNRLALKHLHSSTIIYIDYVDEFLFDSLSKYLIYSISDIDGKTDGVYYRDLNLEFAPEKIIQKNDTAYFSNLTWNQRTGKLAYFKSHLDDKGKPQNSSIWLWNENMKSIQQKILDTNDIKSGWYLPFENNVEWSRNGDLLFFGFKPLIEKEKEENEVKYTEDNFYNKDTILANADIHIWHWDDKLINTHKLKWLEQNRERTFKAVYESSSGRILQLADSSLPVVYNSDNPDYVIGYDDTPYLKELTWGGRYFDLYLIELKTNTKRLIKKRLYDNVHLSPGGNFVLYFDSKDWFLYKTSSGRVTNLTEKLKVPFGDEDNDRPALPYSYGVVGWFRGDSAVIIYDKYDFWILDTYDTDGFTCITGLDGRFGDISFRIAELDDDKEYYTYRDTIFIQAFNRKEKWQRFAMVETWISGPLMLTENNSDYNIIAKAKYANKWFYTDSRFDLFPDIYMSESIEFTNVKKITNYNTQLEKYKWGKTQLVNWVTEKNDTLMGYIMVPENFNPNKKYPLMVYFYEQFSDYLHHFWLPKVWHIPCFQQYVSEDWLVFMPDIKYYIGNPGFSAGESIISGVEHLISKGFIDKAQIGITGHSWAAYQLAHIISQTDLFAAAIAGAPVGNMTSAYSQIRLGSGLARQFQYENTQSRIGGTLWDSLDNYINNSPVFRAPLINTPLLILHGDIDDAVPWEQGIELYLALRRLEKKVYLVQYQNEPHHPKKYPNKLDWAVKTKEFFDHFVKGLPPAKWIIESQKLFE